MSISMINVISTLGSTASVLTADVIIGTLAFTSNSIISLSKYLLTQNEDSITLHNLEKIKDELDILEQIKIYDLCVKEILAKEIFKSVTLNEAVASFYRVIDELNELLKSIDEKAINHRLKWFSSYRSVDFSAELESIKTKKQVLDTRFNLIQKIYGFV